MMSATLRDANLLAHWCGVFDIHTFHTLVVSRLYINSKALCHVLVFSSSCRFHYPLPPYVCFAYTPIPQSHVTKNSCVNLLFTVYLSTRSFLFDATGVKTRAI